MTLLRAVPHFPLVVLTGTCLALAGCATTTVGAEWSDPQFSGRKLVGTPVYVSCQAIDLTLQLVCADKLAAQLKALGAVPVLPPAPADAAGATAPTVGRELAAARAAGAATLLSASLVPDATVVSPGPTFSFGIGGFGGSGGYGTGGGVGVGVPVGGGGTSTGYAVNASLTDVAGGKLMWSAKATAPPSSDVGQQLGTLASTLLDSARKAGYF